MVSPTVIRWMRRALIALCATSLAACATAPKALYSWGSYEQLIYGDYAVPGGIDPQTALAALEKDRQAALSANQRPPPGWHAHLGYLYYQLGKTDQAAQEFTDEKVNFPESRVFMDRLLARLKAS